MVLIFPEGTRTRDGEIAPFRPGFTVLAARSNAWILPLLPLKGPMHAWPRSRSLPGPGTIHVIFGEPIAPDQVAGRDERELMEEVERQRPRCHATLREHPAFAGKGRRA